MAKTKKQIDQQNEADQKVVKMVFIENKFYNDLDNPIFVANKVYELQGQDWIDRWEKRGGKVVEDSKLPKAEQKDGPSTSESAKAADKKRELEKIHGSANVANADKKSKDPVGDSALKGGQNDGHGEQKGPDAHDAREVTDAAKEKVGDVHSDAANL